MKLYRGARSLSEQVIQSLMASTEYQIDRVGFRLFVRDKLGNHIARLQFNGIATEPRCFIWGSSRLSAQCVYSPWGGWSVFPIERGKIAKQPLRGTDPIRFLSRAEPVEHISEAVA